MNSASRSNDDDAAPPPTTSSQGIFFPKQDATSVIDAGSSSNSDHDAEALSNDDDGVQEESPASRLEAGHSVRGQKRRQRIHFDVLQLKSVFHLPLKTAAERLGICEAALKRICRRNQIYRWPYRQLSSVRRRIAELNDRRAELLAERGELPTLVTAAQFESKIQELRAEEDEIIRMVLRPHHRLVETTTRSITTSEDSSYGKSSQHYGQRPILNEEFYFHLQGCQSAIANLPPLDLGRVDRDFPLLFLANVCESVRTYYYRKENV
uniref:RWP-RK domain-containing protein n=1 Tax=Peronospora matthiolae TaxID=2874970 RepID=A0AAV1V836_9STRA